MTAPGAKAKTIKDKFRHAWREAFAKDAKRRKRQHFAPSNDPAFNKLLEFFGGNFFRSIVKPNAADAEWSTRFCSTPPRTLYDLYHSRETIIGLRFGGLTRLLVLDIDFYSHYHPAINTQEFSRLLGVLESMGLVGVAIVQSSASGGLHLYIPLPEAVPSWIAAKTLTVGLVNARFKIGNGILELFPNCKEFCPGKVINYNGLRLPLQPDSASYLLDSHTLEPESHDLTQFVACLEHHAGRQDFKHFKRMMRVAYEGFRVRKGRVSSRNSSATVWHHELLRRLQTGWTGQGQTNSLICDAVVEKYVFGHLDGTELIEAVCTGLESLPGYQEFCRHQHHLPERIKDWLHCVKALYYPYTGEYRDRQVNYGDTVQSALDAGREDGRKHNPVNAQREQATRNKLAAAIKLLLGQDCQEQCIRTYTALLDRLSQLAKEHLGQGFSRQLLQRYKGLLERVRNRLQRRSQQTTLAPESVQIPPSEILKPAPEAALLATLPNPSQAEIPEILPTGGVTGYLPIYEGGGADAQRQAPCVSWSFVRSWFLETCRSLQMPLVYSGDAVATLIQDSPLSRFVCHYLDPLTSVVLTPKRHSLEDDQGLVYVHPLGSPHLIFSVSLAFLTLYPP